MNTSILKALRYSDSVATIKKRKKNEEYKSVNNGNLINVKKNDKFTFINNGLITNEWICVVDFKNCQFILYLEYNNKITYSTLI